MGDDLCDDHLHVGSLLWEWSSDVLCLSATVADVVGDVHDEVIIGSVNGQSTVLDAASRVIWTSPSLGGPVIDIGVA